MEHIDDRVHGEPTSAAEAAMRVASILEFVEDLRVQLRSHNDQLAVLEERYVNMAEHMEELDAHHRLLSDLASTAVTRLMRVTNRSLIDQFRRVAQSTQKNLEEFETDYHDQQERYLAFKQNVEDKQEVINRFTSEIMRRMDEIDKLLKGAGIAWPPYYFESELKSLIPGRRRGGTGMGV